MLKSIPRHSSVVSYHNNPEGLKIKDLELYFSKYTAPINNGIEYIDVGTGEPLLFLHGALSNYNTWRKIIPLLSKNYRCIVPNLPLGAHRVPLSKAADLTPTGISTLINELLIHLKLKTVTIISNDTGGAYAQIFATHYPDKVSKLILSNCEALEVFPPSKFAYLKAAVRIPGFTYIMSRVFAIKSLLKTEMMLGLLSLTVKQEELYQLYVYSFIHDNRVRENFRRVARSWSPSYTQEAAAVLKHFDKPVLILWGDQDFTLFPLTLGYKLKNIFPNATLVEIKNARTYIQEDQPEKTAEEIEIFMRH